MADHSSLGARSSLTRFSSAFSAPFGHVRCARSTSSTRSCSCVDAGVGDFAVAFVVPIRQPTSPGAAGARSLRRTQSRASTAPDHDALQALPTQRPASRVVAEHRTSRNPYPRPDATGSEAPFHAGLRHRIPIAASLRPRTYAQLNRTLGNTPYRKSSALETEQESRPRPASRVASWRTPTRPHGQPPGSRSTPWLCPRRRTVDADVAAQGTANRDSHRRKNAVRRGGLSGGGDPRLPPHSPFTKRHTDGVCRRCP
jgi:hypothetical protein